MPALREKFHKSVVYNSCGDRMRPKETLRRDERGNYTAVVVDRIDIVKQIQSYENGTDVHKIVARYNAVGDPRILSFDPSAFGGSAVGVPTDMKSMYDTIKKAEDVYKGLPQDIAKNYSCLGDFLGDFIASTAPKKDAKVITTAKPQTPPTDKNNAPGGDTNA